MLVIDERTRRVAKWISDYLEQSGDRFQKTIVFCVDTEHTARMRQASIDENADLVQHYSRYIMRITGFKNAVHELQAALYQETA